VDRLERAGSTQNADNPVVLGAGAFLFEKAETRKTAEGRELKLFFHGDEKAGNPLRLALVYRSSRAAAGPSAGSR